MVAELVGAHANGEVAVGSWSGAEGTRTPGLNAASVALFQLSYSPSKLEVCRKVNGRPLTVAGRGETKPDLRPPTDQSARQKVALVEITAVDRQQVDLVGGVGAATVVAVVKLQVTQLTLITLPLASSAAHLHCTRMFRPATSNPRS